MAKDQKPAKPEIVDDGEAIEIDPGSPRALQAISMSEINMQITMSKRHPRSIQTFMNECRDMACVDEGIARDCMYSLKRKGADGEEKLIEGPSARFAEIVLSAWTNAQAGARIIDEDDRFITAQGAFYDTQRNTRITFEVRRRITTKKGYKFGDDMVAVTGNAAASIALRNAILRGVPKAFWEPIFEDTRQTAIGKAETLVDRRHKMFEAFGKMGVTSEKIFQYLGVKGAEDVTLEHVLHMIGVFNGIRDGEKTIDEVFNPAQPEAGSKASESSLNEKFAKREDFEGGPTGSHGAVNASFPLPPNNDVAGGQAEEESPEAQLEKRYQGYLKRVEDAQNAADLDTITTDLPHSGFAELQKMEIITRIGAKRKTLPEPTKTDEPTKANKKKAGEQASLPGT